MRKQLAFLISLSLASGASAADWVSFATCGASSQPRYYSYDASSVTRDGSNVLVHVKGDYSRVRGSRASEGQIVWAMNCQNRTFVERSRTEYRPDRSIAESYGSPTGAMTIGPNSVPDKLLQKVCA